jgi:hypothetical protein
LDRLRPALRVLLGSLGRRKLLLGDPCTLLRRGDIGIGGLLAQHDLRLAVQLGIGGSLLLRSSSLGLLTLGLSPLALDLRSRTLLRQLAFFRALLGLGVVDCIADHGPRQSANDDACPGVVGLVTDDAASHASEDGTGHGAIVVGFADISLLAPTAIDILDSAVDLNIARADIDDAGGRRQGPVAIDPNPVAERLPPRPIATDPHMVGAGTKRPVLVAHWRRHVVRPEMRTGAVVRPDIVPGTGPMIAAIIAHVAAAIVLTMFGAAVIVAIVATVTVVGIRRREQSKSRHTGEHEGNFGTHGWMKFLRFICRYRRWN